MSNLSKRDQFAFKALEILMAQDAYTTASHLANVAYDTAEAMLSAEERRAKSAGVIQAPVLNPDGPISKCGGTRAAYVHPVPPSDAGGGYFRAGRAPETK